MPTAHLDGSFVTDKVHPEDYDACWDEAGVGPAVLDPVLLTFDEGRAAQKAKCRGGLFPASCIADSRGLSVAEFSQTDRTAGRPRGVIAINLESPA